MEYRKIVNIDIKAFNYAKFNSLVHIDQSNCWNILKKEGRMEEDLLEKLKDAYLDLFEEEVDFVQDLKDGLLKLESDYNMALYETVVTAQPVLYLFLPILSRALWSKDDLVVLNMSSFPVEMYNGKDDIIDLIEQKLKETDKYFKEKGYNFYYGY